MMAGLKERLRRARCWHVGANLPGMKLPATKWFELSPTLPAEALARIEELEAALRPFADIADIADTDDEVGRDDPDDDRIWVIQAHGCQLAEMSVGDFRRARQAIAENNHG